MGLCPVAAVFKVWCDLVGMYGYCQETRDRISFKRVSFLRILLQIKKSFTRNILVSKLRIYITESLLEQSKGSNCITLRSQCAQECNFEPPKRCAERRNTQCSCAGIISLV
jgi:hypothetical protein